MENLKKTINKLSFKKHGRLLGFGTSPKADWKVIFVSTVLLSLGVLVLSVYMFIKVDKGEIFLTARPDIQRSNTLNVSLLRETLNYYQNKESEFERIKNSPSPAVDPSL